MRASALILPVLLAACSSLPAQPSSSRSASVAPTTNASAEATPTGDLASLQSHLPSSLGGVELHTFAVGQDILDRLATELDLAPDEIEAAYASEHGARFLQTYALRLAGTPAAALAAGWSVAAYPPEVDDVVVSNQTIAGRAVRAVHAPSAAARVGTFYLVPQDEILFVVQALDPDVAAEAIGSLP